MSSQKYIDTLPEGYALHWYEFKSVLGRGGFGITYLAVDKNLDQPVAIKEYLPTDVASRKNDQTVHPTTGEDGEIFHWGLERFLKEARVLAKFKHPNIVRVLSVFEQNNTAYMVMEYEQGKDLSVLFKERKRKSLSWSEQELLAIYVPILDGLSLIHSAGFIHRDAKPANIYIRNEGSPVLIDFGSARQTMGGKTQALTSLVTYGYAPFEQYNDEGGKQGPWTDIYSLGASLHLAITGQLPVDALTRAARLYNENTDPYQPVSEFAAGRYSSAFLQAIDHALMFRGNERPQDAAEWSDMLKGNVDVKATPEPAVEITPKLDSKDELTVVRRPTHRNTSPADATLLRTEKEKKTVLNLNNTQQETQVKKENNKKLTIIAVVVLIIMVAIAMTVIFINKAPSKLSATKENSAPATEQKTIPVLSPMKPEPVKKPIESIADQISQLLTVAEEYLNQGRILRPEGGDAISTYRHILELEPQNRAALEGIEQILVFYTEEVERHLSNHELDSAEQVAEKIAMIAPASILSRKIQKKVMRARIEEEGVAELLQLAKGYLDSKQFLEPRGNNAFDTYNEVLALDGKNSTAIAGIEKIKVHYKALFQKYIADEKIGEAESVAETITTIASGSALERTVYKTLKKAKEPKKIKKPSRPEIEEISDIMGQFKAAFDARDKKKIAALSEYSSGRASFVGQLFDQYRSVTLDISGFKYISSAHKAEAKASLTSLVNKSGRAVQPGSWANFDFVVRQNSRGHWRVFW